MVANANICFLSQISSHLSDSEGQTQTCRCFLLMSSCWASLHPPNASPLLICSASPSLKLELVGNLLPPVQKVATLTTSLFAC